MENEVKIYSGIGLDFFDLYKYGIDNSATSVVQKIESALEKGGEVIIRIDSPGGYIVDGLTIANIIHKNNCTTRVDGSAMSMAGIILFSGKKVQAYKSSIIHIHSAIDYCFGNKYDMQESIELLNSFEKPIISIIARKTGLSVEEVEKRWFDGKEHFLTPEEALKIGLIDEIIDGEASFPAGVPSSKIQNSSYSAVMNAYEKMAKKNNSQQSEKNIFTKIFNSKNKKMNEELLKALNLAENSSQEQVLEAVRALQNSQKTEKNKLSEDLQAAQNALEAADKQLQENKSKLESAEAKIKELEKTPQDSFEKPKGNGSDGDLSDDDKIRAQFSRKNSQEKKNIFE